jgi:hypothetical protein
MTRTVRQGYWIGSAFLLFGLIELAGFPGGSGLVKLERLVTAILLAEVVPSSVELRWRPRDHEAAFMVSS